MNSYYRRIRFRKIMIITFLTVLGLLTTIGPIIYVMTAKPVTEEGPIVGPRK